MAAGAHGNASSRILLVEDDPVMAAVEMAMLRDVGEVHWADSAEMADLMLVAEDWSLVVADIGLPGISGLQFMRAVKDRLPHAATLILTGHATFDNAVGAVRVGADDFMTKPVAADELIARARELIDSARARHGDAARQAVLAIGAHPDDAELGVGGILLRHVDAGDSVAILTLTGGGSYGAPSERALAAATAAELLAARLFHHDIPDTSPNEDGAAIQAIELAIATFAPTTIYTHALRDADRDHRNVHRATLAASGDVPRIFGYQGASTAVDFHPTRFVTIDDQLERKLDATQPYASSHAERAYLEPDLVRATARYWGHFTRSRYAEPLEVIRDSDVGAPETDPAPAFVAGRDDLGQPR